MGDILAARKCSRGRGNVEISRAGGADGPEVRQPVLGAEVRRPADERSRDTEAAL